MVPCFLFSLFFFLEHYALYKYAFVMSFMYSLHSSYGLNRTQCIRSVLKRKEINYAAGIMFAIKQKHGQPAEPENSRPLPVICHNRGQPNKTRMQTSMCLLECTDQPPICQHFSSPFQGANQIFANPQTLKIADPSI